jgi:hypothetical protein
MKYPVDVLKIVAYAGLCISALLFIAAYSNYRDTEQIRQYIKRITADNQSNSLLDMQIDLSKPGEYKGLYTQKYFINPSDDICINLSLPQKEFHEKPVSSVLTGLNATVTITNLQNGQKVFGEHISVNKPISKNFYNGIMELLYLDSLPMGTYELHCVVEEGAPALKNIPQNLKAEIRLSCDTLDSEGLGPIVTSFLILLALAFAIPSFACILWKRFKKRHANTISNVHCA